MTPAAERKAVAHLMDAHRLSERRACKTIGSCRMTMRYKTTRTNDGRLRQCMNDLPVSVVFADRDFQAKLPPSTPSLEAGEALHRLSKAVPQFDNVAIKAGDPCSIFFTSGSSGLPKAVEFSFESAERAIAAPTTLGFNAQSRLQIVAPLFHTAGWVWCCYGLTGGMTIILLPQASPDRMTSAVADLGASHVQWHPTMLDTVLEQQARNPRDLSALRMIAYGAAPIAPEMLERCYQTFNCEFSQVYGLTETVGPVGHLAPAAHRIDWGSGGPPTVSINPGISLRVVDKDGREVAPGEVGEIEVQLSYPAPSYLRQGRRIPIARSDGWIATSDMGAMDTDGYVRVIGRWGDMIITGGENVYPSEVENVIATFPEVAEVAVFGRRDQRWGQAICAMVALRPEAEMSAAEVIERCRKQIAGYKTPKTVFFVERLPRNPAGKVVRPALEPLAVELEAAG
ncbi:acyl-CoA synthetase (AMP-forming)/AMP-acid ligase II [Bradyrhizobium sp. USDA 4537]|nr:acyl-CoA synthetase (AMP-forming)/AMP-acid ligase II [Bradyrhizobium sp. USDA 4537]MCP1985190.1 acyl-CoA synthetase (AMP-forming)/AMP-acid ligase II [Bradyrhizobium sp. USDA 4539]